MAKCVICGEKMSFWNSDTNFEIFVQLHEHALKLEKNTKIGPNYHYVTLFPDTVTTEEGFYCDECQKNLRILSSIETCNEETYIKMRNRILNRKYNLTFSTASLISYIDELYTTNDIIIKTKELTKSCWEKIENNYGVGKFVYPNLQKNNHVCATRYKENLVLIENRDPKLNLAQNATEKIWKSNFETFKNFDIETMFAISIIPIENIVSYQSTGYVEHTTTISGGGGHGGGVNKKGAIVGGLLLGGAGAIVGSQIGTEIFINPITSNIVEYDYRKTMLNLKNAEGQVEIKELPYYYAEVFQKVIPEKEFNFLQANKNTEVQTPINSINMLEEMKQLKELLDIGLITQEEFDSKRKQILKL